MIWPGEESHADRARGRVSAPGAHDEIWPIQRTLDFVGTVAGVDRAALAGESAMSALTATYAELYGRHRDDRPLAD
jgi:hypothetical protein